MPMIISSNILMEPQPQSPINLSPDHQHPRTITLCSLIDSIEFTKKTKVRSTKTHSETDSLSSGGHNLESKEKSKVWSEEETELFGILLKKYGTDFHILSTFFPKKTKNQLKNRYKVYANMERKREKAESSKLQAVSRMFNQMEELAERQQRQEKEEECL